MLRPRELLASLLISYTRFESRFKSRRAIGPDCLEGICLGQPDGEVTALSRLAADFQATAMSGNQPLSHAQAQPHAICFNGVQGAAIKRRKDTGLLLNRNTRPGVANAYPHLALVGAGRQVN